MISRKRLSIVPFSLALVWLAAGCAEKKPMEPETPGGGTSLFALGSDFVAKAGILRWMGLDGTALSSDSLVIYQDADIRSFGGFVYILEKFGADNIIKYDPLKGEVVYQKHLGTNWNPVDMVFLSETKAYIACENVPKILVYDPSSGTVVKEISDSMYTYVPPVDSGSKASSPNAYQMAIIDSILYVSLQRRNGTYANSDFSVIYPNGTGALLRINTKTDLVMDTLETKFKAPGAMAAVNGTLYIASSGAIGTKGDGAIENFNPTNRQWTVAVDENTLGGDPSGMVQKMSTEFFVQVYVAWGDEPVKRVDLAAGTVLSTIADVTDAFGGIAYDTGSDLLFVGERKAAETGIKVFQGNGTQVRGPIPFDLPPSAMAVVSY